jgi:general secretion pathway protein D
MKNIYLLLMLLLSLSSNSILAEDLLDTEIEKCLPVDENLYAVNFTNATLNSILKDLGMLLKINFIPDDIIKDGIAQPQARNLDEIRITYSASQKINAEEIMSLLGQFLAISDLTIQPVPNLKNYYRVTTTTNANRLALPTFIGINPNDLPNHGRIRYVYFLANASAAGMKNVADKLKSNSAIVEIYKDLNALIITDEAYNVDSMMKIIKELDESTTPEVMTVIRLKEASSQEVVALYESLKGKDDPFKRSFGAKETNARYYFSQDVRMISEPRSNSLIILGPKESVERIEKFIFEYVDTEINYGGRKLFKVKIEFNDATQIAQTLSAVTKFGASSDIAQAGGVRGGERYFSNIVFTADPNTNTLIILATEDEYKLILPTIKKLDQRQPQVALEILIVNVDYNILKQMGTALRNQCPGNVNFQSTSFNTDQTQAVINPVTGSLMGNLINLATTTSAGSFVLSLGRDSVWALFNISEQIQNLNTVAHPFLTTINKYPAKISIAEERRINSATVASGFTQQTEQMSLPAKLEVLVTPQISSDGTINLDVQVTDEEFTDPINFNNGNKISRIIKTNADVKDGQALAIGGLNRYQKNSKKNGPAPFISNIPILGNLFTARSDESISRNLLILIFPTILTSDDASFKKLNKFTGQKAQYIYDVMNERSEIVSSPRDPIYQWFFDYKDDSTYKLQSNDIEYIIHETAEQAEEKVKEFEPDSVLDWIR